MKREIINDIPKQIVEFLAMPNGVEKNIKYKKINTAFITKSYASDENGEYFSVSQGVVKKFGNKYSLKYTCKTGLSFKNGKVEFWWGSNINYDDHLYDLFKVKKWNFIEPQFYSFVTKTILEKLFKGKITNTKQMLREYLKSVRIKCSVDFLYKAVKTQNDMFYERKLTKQLFYKHAVMAKNVDHFLIRWINKELKTIPYLYDLMEQFEILELKIDYKWSNKRFLNEHQKATETLMMYEIKTIKDIKINYPKIYLPDNIKILNTKKLVFIEGTKMHHCIYTNYWWNILRGTYVGFNVQYNNVMATLGCRLNTATGLLEFDQLYGIRNSQVSEDFKKYCLKFVELNKYMFIDFVLNDKEREIREQLILLDNKENL